MGNPHLVIFVEEDEEISTLAQSYGAILSSNPSFPEGANISFVKGTHNGFTAVVYERGVGLTLACGSGACAVGLAAVQRGLWRTGSMVVRLPGGSLEIDVKPDNSVVMQGEAVRVFEGNIDPQGIYL
ncbi:MAG: hypothetical protein R3C68_05990 [Myxococcota bacterium]